MTVQRKKILGLDFGEKRVGLALAEAGSIAVPFTIIARESDSQLIKSIREIISSEDIDLIVIGLPTSLSGQASERTIRTQQFIDKLKSDINIPVETVDETFSSKLYEKQGVTKDIDKHAAAAILDTYLSQHGS